MIVVCAVILVSGVLFAAYELQGRLRVQITTDKDTYVSGEPVTIVVILKNVGIQTLHLTFSSSGRGAYIVESLNGTEVFHPSIYVTFGFTKLTLRPGESQETTFGGDYSWKQVDNEGKPVDVPDSYIIRPEVSDLEMDNLNLIWAPKTITVTA